MDSVKGLIILCVAVAVVGISLLLQPWSELGFGFDEKQVPEWAKPIVASSVFQQLKPYGEKARDYLVGKTKTEQAEGEATTNLDALNVGNYTYALVMAIAMVLAAFAIILIGREDSEEKTYVPVKK
ncbi:MAG TPA: hypothetical protein V6C72_09045 [Chroococcales cyanobacterium]